MIQIQDRIMKLPIIQGGMGVGISLSSLAGHVAKCGAMGVISAAHPGYNYEGFRKNPIAVNCQALKDHIQRAKELAKGNGLIGVNIKIGRASCREGEESSRDEGDYGCSSAQHIYR